MVVGNGLVYEDDKGSPAASMLEMKLLLNIIISDAQQGAIFMSCDLKYLPEYTKTHIQFPQDMIEKYNLMNKVLDRNVYIKIKKGMYGLK